MEIMKDIFPRAKLPIISLIALYYIQLVLVTVIDRFTTIEIDHNLNIMVLGGINLAFILCAWVVIAWAGLRTAKATGGGPIDGAFGGAMAAVIAGLFVRIASLLFSVSTLPVLIAYSPSGTSAGFAAGIIGIFFGIVAIVLGFIIDLIFGAVLGFLGALVHKANPGLFAQYGIGEAKPVKAKVVKAKKWGNHEHKAKGIGRH